MIILGAQGLSFAVPVDTARWVIGQIMTVGRVRRGYLGVAAQPRPLPKRISRKHELGDSGVEVVHVEPGKPAAKGGLEAGDIVVSLGGKPVKTVDDVHRVLDASSIGRALPASVLRGEKLLQLRVTPAEG
jgi:S1-C subfamily serine protease